MATTTNYGWTTPDDTALVKNGAAAIRTLGSSVDTTTKNLNPETTLGDIAYRSSTANVKTRLGIGSTGNVLTVVGGVPAWAAPAGGGGSNWTLLNTGGTALSGATTTVSGISAKSKILVLCTYGTHTASQVEIGLRLNNDASGNYTQVNSRIQSRTTYNANQITMNGATSQNIINLGSTGAGINKDFAFAVLIDGCNSTGLKTYTSVGGGFAGVDLSRIDTGMGFYNSSSTISSISVRADQFNFASGSVFVYTSDV